MKKLMFCAILLAATQVMLGMGEQEGEEVEEVTTEVIEPTEMPSEEMPTPGEEEPGEEIEEMNNEIIEAKG